MKPNSRKHSNGFTLIELLLSMVITTIIISILVTVTVVSLDIWNRSRAELRASNQGKAMIEAMSADFESMVVRCGNDFQWIFAEFSPPADGPNSNLSPNALNLIFFSAATDRYNGQIGEGADLGGDISNIGYQLTYKDPISDEDVDNYKTFVLYRKIIDPKPTFENTLGRVDLKTAFETYTANPANAVDSMENFVCENVYQFTVKFHVDILKNNQTFSVGVSLEDNQQFILTGDTITSPAVTGRATIEEIAAGRLTAVEVSLTVLTDGAIKQLRGRNFNDDQLSDFIAENSYQYSKIISVPSY
jgi:prepilin-type N-terminal cleavage/methylation domain-containing protein